MGSTGIAPTRANGKPPAPKVVSAAPGVGVPKERGILFSAAMVKAILAGSKTQTRRLVNPQPGHRWNHVDGLRFCEGEHDRSLGCRGDIELRCPYGVPGDRLWVREKWAAHWMYNDVPARDARCESVDSPENPAHRWYAADGNDAPSDHGLKQDGYRGRWRVSIHMPRWASRITLEVTAVRAERLQDITPADARAEGVQVDEVKLKSAVDDDERDLLHVDAYADLWDAINGAGSWDASPWVWVVSFRVLDTTGRAA